MTADLCSDPPAIVSQIPTPDAIVRRLGETAAERRVLRALLKVARMRERQGLFSPAGDTPATNARPALATTQ